MSGRGDYEEEECECAWEEGLRRRGVCGMRELR